MDADLEQSKVSRRQLIKRGAVVGGAALWVPPVIQSLTMPAHAQVGSPEPPVECIVDGYMTGKGSVDLAGFSVDYELRKLDCPPLSSPPELKVNWSDGGVDYSFELFSFTSRLCTDDPNIPNGTNANFDTSTGSGNGTLTVDGVPESASVSFQFVDAGEGNNSPDSASITIVGVNSGQVLSFANEVIDKGSQQAHDGNFAFGEACLR